MCIYLLVVVKFFYLIELRALNSIRYLTFLLTFSLQLTNSIEYIDICNKLLTTLNSIET